MNRVCLAGGRRCELDVARVELHVAKTCSKGQSNMRWGTSFLADPEAMLPLATMQQACLPAERRSSSCSLEAVGGQLCRVAFSRTANYVWTLRRVQH